MRSAITVLLLVAVGEYTLIFFYLKVGLLLAVDNVSSPFLHTK